MCMGLSVCHVLQFSDGVVIFIMDMSTADMPRPGQAHVVNTQESIVAVNSLVRENRWITTWEIADSLSVSKGTVDTILHEHLQYSKVCAQWVPKHLTEDQKCLRMGVCLQHLLHYRTEGNNFSVLDCGLRQNLVPQRWGPRNRWRMVPQATQDFLRWRYPTSRGPMGHLFQPTRRLCIGSMCYTDIVYVPLFNL